ncbi:MAG TPA: hypothetical protein VFV41_21085, partial [Streptosporangiaceae bacterium]|nr:hypothetical protein [Streptosporangiaceae bacterium]
IFRQAQAMLSARRALPAEHRPHRSKHHYALRGLLLCGLCSRRMQGLWANNAPYYRCRFPSEYALANLVSHPRNVTLRQDAILRPLDAWLGSKFRRQHLAATVDELAAAAALSAGPAAAREDIRANIAACDRKLAQYRAALDAGGDPVVIARWISETEAARAAYEATRTPEALPLMTREDIAAVVESLADLPGLLSAADPADKADIYTGIGLRLTYQPDPRSVLAEVRLGDQPHWRSESVRGGT